MLGVVGREVSNTFLSYLWFRATRRSTPPKYVPHESGAKALLQTSTTSWFGKQGKLFTWLSSVCYWLVDFRVQVISCQHFICLHLLKRNATGKTCFFSPMILALVSTFQLSSSKNHIQHITYGRNPLVGIDTKIQHRGCWGYGVWTGLTKLSKGRGW